MREAPGNSRVGVAAALASGALGIGVLSSRGRLRELDGRLFHLMNRARGHAPDAVFKGITELGSIFGSIGAFVAVWGAGHRKAAGRSLAAAGTTWALGQLLKRASMRPRPYEEFAGASRLLIGMPRGTSWPSSHPAVLLTFCTVAEKEMDLSPETRRVLLAIAGAVGLSRVYLGVHFPSDVVSGLMIGRAMGLAWASEKGDRR